MKKVFTISKVKTVKINSIIIMTVLLLTIRAGNIFSQTFQWVQQAGGISSDYGNGIKVDAVGNSYVTGWFQDTATFGNFTVIGNGLQDFFIAKYDASGVCQWVRQAGSVNNDEGYNVDIDASGNIYATGGFEGNITFGNITLNNIGGEDIFIAKYDASGVLQWAKKAGSSGQGNNITVDPSGNSYITGFFEGTAAFGSFSITTNGQQDIFIAKYDSSGICQWVQKAGSVGFDWAWGISLDKTGNAYVTGSFKGTAIFGSTSVVSSGDEDIFVAKYNAFGTLQWVEKAGGVGLDAGLSTSVDSLGNAYVIGNYGGTATFDNVTLSNSGYDDIFVAKYNAAGTLQWVRNAGGANPDQGYDIKVTASGHVYVTGTFGSTAAFGTTNFTSTGQWDWDAFIAEYDTSGTLQWVQKAEGAAWQKIGYGIDVDASGNIYATGVFRSTCSFGSITLTSDSASSDVFVAKISAGPAAIAENNLLSTTVSVYPNPFSISTTINIDSKLELKNAEIIIYDLLGKKVKKSPIVSNLSLIERDNLVSGIYFYQLTNTNQIIGTGKLIIQ